MRKNSAMLVAFATLFAISAAAQATPYSYSAFYSSDAQNGTELYGINNSGIAVGIYYGPPSISNVQSIVVKPPNIVEVFNPKIGRAHV